MGIKLGGLLEKAMERSESKICRNCGNLAQISKTALGCIAHDKLIMPDYPPYHGYAKCNDWIDQDNTPREKGADNEQRD